MPATLLTTYTPTPMSDAHGCRLPAGHRELPAGVAQTLPAAAQERWLRLASGRVWATRTLRSGEAEDCWIGAGQSLHLPAGSAWVLEAWPAACVSLVQAWPQPARRRAAWPRLAWRALSVWRPAGGRASMTSAPSRPCSPSLPSLPSLPFAA